MRKLGLETMLIGNTKCLISFKIFFTSASPVFAYVDLIFCIHSVSDVVVYRVRNTFRIFA